MGEAFNAYLQSLRDRNEMQARQFAQQQAQVTGLAMQIQEKLQEVAEKREKARQMEGAYQMKARDAGLFQEQPDYELPQVKSMQGQQEAILRRRQQVEQELGGIPEAGVMSTEGMGDEQGLMKRREKLAGELQRNQAAFQRIEGEIKRLKDSPNYADQVKAAQWQDFLRKNPEYSETYYRAMSYEEPAQPKQSEVIAKQRQAQSSASTMATKRQSYIRDFNRQLAELEQGFGKDKAAKIKIIKEAIDRMNQATSVNDIDLINSQAAAQLAEGALSAAEAEGQKETRAQRKAREKAERSKQGNANPPKKVDVKQSLEDDYGF